MAKWIDFLRRKFLGWETGWEVIYELKAGDDVHYIKVVMRRDGNGYHASCPAMPGCHTWGATGLEAIENMREAMTLYIESLIAHPDEDPSRELENKQ